MELGVALQEAAQLADFFLIGILGSHDLLILVDLEDAVEGNRWLGSE
jgi:hypothetical protein